MWIKDFLSQIRLTPLSTGAPQGCVLGPLIFSLYTSDCTAAHLLNTIIKVANNTTVAGLITDGNESAYRNEIRNVARWCIDNNLTLNIKKKQRNTFLIFGRTRLSR